MPPTTIQTAASDRKVLVSAGISSRCGGFSLENLLYSILMLCM